MDKVENSSGMQIKGDLILVKPDDTETKTEGGLVLPQTTIDKEQMRQKYGVVVDISPNAWDVIPERCKVGDRIYFVKYAGEEIPGADGITYRAMKSRDVLAVVLQPPLKKELSVTSLNYDS